MSPICCRNSYLHKCCRNFITTERVTCTIIKEPQSLYNCNRRCHLHNCYRKCQFHSSNRNCHLQNWLQKLSLEEMVTVRYFFSYNHETDRMSKHQFWYYLYNLMENVTAYFLHELCYTLIISIFSFVLFRHSTNQITSKPSLAQRLNLIFHLRLINYQINIPLWTCMGHKGRRKIGKTFTRCYTIALKFWDEFSANFVLLHFSCYKSTKMKLPPAELTTETFTGRNSNSQRFF